MIITHKVSLEPNFGYHWRCEKAKITHLCFADDLIIFCGGKLESATILKQALDIFFSLSGLSANEEKSQIYIAGKDNAYRNALLRLFGFQEGSLPARYLGVPLISSKLSSKDCKNLVDKVAARIKSWTSKHLSYAGRLQLIISDLSSLQVYWMGLFLLPKQVTYQLDQLLRSFLWSGSDLKLKGAKVSWDMITRLKSEGGLGIKKN